MKKTKSCSREDCQILTAHVVAQNSKSFAHMSAPKLWQNISEV